MIDVFPNRESCLRYACCRLMEIDKEWQTRRKYIKISEEDRASDIDEDLMNEITKIKQRVSSEEELVAG